MAGRMTLVMIAGGLLISCASAATGSWADETRAGSQTGPVSVVVLGEDAHPALLPRGDPAFRRVVAELQEAMDRRGFRVVDAAAIAADLGWNPPAIGGKADALEAAKLANASGRAAHRVEAAVLFRIQSTYRDLRYTTRIDLHLSGEIYDVRSNRFLGSFDLPAETVSTAGRCLDVACASEAVGSRARDLAGELGAVLARRLAGLTSPSEPQRESSGAAVAATDEPVREAVYTVTLRHLSTEDALSIIAVMTDGFPGYRSHDLMASGMTLRRYAYMTTASAAEIERWLTLLLVDMDLTPREEVVLAVRDGDIRIERLPALPGRSPG